MDVSNKTLRRLAWAAVLALFLAIYLGSAFSPALQDDVDTSHAEAAREMLTRGDFVTLHINGVRYLEKAPLMYWLVAASYRLLGISVFATHLPTLAAMCLLVILGIVWGSRAFGARAGIYTGLFTATGVGFFLFTRVLIPEAILSFLIAASFYCLVCALDESSSQANARWNWYAIYVLLAFAVLTKGLLALVVFGLTLPAYLAITGEWRRWREFRLFSGLLLFLVIAAPWHILAGLRNPPFDDHHGFLWFYFVNEHFLRFPRQAHSQGLQQAFRISLLDSALGLALSLEPISATRYPPPHPRTSTLGWLTFAFFWRMWGVQASTSAPAPAGFASYGPR